MVLTRNADNHRLSPNQILANAAVQNLIHYYKQQHSSPTNSRDDESFDSFKTCMSQTPETPSSNQHTSKEARAKTWSLDRAEDNIFCHDPTLTAFAQLGTFKLHCNRAIISLVDSKSQYILSEATKSVSLKASHKADPGDELFLGNRFRDRAWGICPATIEYFQDEDGSLPNSDTLMVANKKLVMINDMSEVPCCTDKEFVSGWPYFRFFAEVPIKTRSGLVVGSFSLVDSAARYDFGDDQLEKLQEIASAVARHLELVQAQKNLERSKEMVKALGLFAEGKPTLRQWWTDAFNRRASKLEVQTVQKLDKIPDFNPDLATASDRLEAFLQAPDPSTFDSNDSDSFDSSPGYFDSAAATGSQTNASPLDEEATQCDRVPTTQGALREQINQFDMSPKRKSIDNYAAMQREETLSYGAIRALFSRASHMIREASDLEGIIFVNASLQDIEIGRGKLDADTWTTQTETETRSNTRSSLGRSNSMETHIEKSSSDGRSFKMSINKTSSMRKPMTTCEMLGYSLRDSPGGANGQPSRPQLTISQNVLRGLLKLYPHGQIFMFDRAGLPIHYSDIHPRRQSKSQHRRHRTNKEKRFEWEKEQLRTYQLLDICPGAKAVIFFPLWDPQNNQWFAGSLAWTNDPGRILQSEDVTYLAGFGSCIMAEKSKVDALTADKAKADFISSISHELRTPLHGMLATLDAMDDGSRTVHDDEMIRTMTTCGEVLLDTMDHIMSNKKGLKVGSENGQAGGTMISSSSITTFDLGILVETVVEGILAGHGYGTQSSRTSGGDDHHFSRRRSRLIPSGMINDVTVVLDIEKRNSWLFQSQIGAWKRILTNLFGNALKYTNLGFVQVSLQTDSMPNGADGTTLVTLEVSDSGIGMTQDFLTNQLYMPFVQANPLSVGTGLGLSIVRQLVKDLKGYIEVESEIEYGTSFKVAIQLSNPETQEPSDTSSDGSATIRDIGALAKDLTLCIIGFDYLPDLDEASTGILGVHARRMLALRRTLVSFASDWFGLTVIVASSIADAEGHILLGLQSRINQKEMLSRTEPLIVLEDVFRGPRTEDTGGIFHLSQPFGPHKLARIIGACLEYRSSFTDSVPTQEIASKRSRLNSYGFLDRSHAASEYAGSSSAESDRTIVASKPSPPRALRPASTTNLLTPLPEIITDPPERSLVLLVEDNPVNMKILVNHMKRAQEPQISAINGLEALHKYQAAHESIKIIFMDISMPIMDGIMSATRIRKFEKENALPRVRIVALTCFSSLEYQQKAFEAGIDVFMVKPVLMKNLKPLLDMDPKVVVPPRSPSGE